MPNVPKDAAAAAAGFETRMLGYVETAFADQFAALGAPAVRALIREGVERAAAWGLESEREACRYLDLLLTFGTAVDAPGSRVAAALKGPAGSSDTKRLDQAFERAWRDRLLQVKKQVKRDFSDQPVALAMEPEFDLRATPLSFSWNGAIKVARKRATVSAPHWEAGLDLQDGAGSSRPAASLVGSSNGSGQATLNLRLEACSGIAGTLQVAGRLGELRLTGSLPAQVGEHEVSLTLGPLPTTLQAAQGDVVWELRHEALNEAVALAPPTRLEWYALRGQPAAFFRPAGVWVEALRFLFGTVGVSGLAGTSEVIDKVARYCHASHGVRYDTFHGAPAYGCASTGGAFQLASYLAAAKPVVNCYDQAAAVQTLCGALGVAVNWFYLRPFGFIHTTNLVGVGPCNNPFFSNDGVSPTVGVNDRDRTAFANHAFAGLAEAVLDACAGPHTGTEDQARYVSASIDSGTTLYQRYRDFRPGTAADIITPEGVTKVV